MQMLHQSGKARTVLARTLIAVISLTAMVFGPVQTAHADPGCVNGGVYVLFARGSGEVFGDYRANQFYWSLIGDAGHPGALYGKATTAWAELGNLDNDRPNGQKPDDPATEYPAVPVNDWHAINVIDGGYNNSVRIGTDELVKHLNDRASRCPGETVIIGGYSQGADVVGWAIQRAWNGDTSWSLGPTARDHIGYVALYGDPKFDAGSVQNRMAWIRPWWVRGDDTGFRYRGSPYDDTVPNNGALSARNPYAPSDMYGRMGSWCAYNDGVCAGIWPNGMDVHSYSYQNYWIRSSAAEVAGTALDHRDHLYFHGVPPNGAVVENYDGGNHKYVAIGGSLVYIPSGDDIWGYVSQMQRLYPSGQFHDILRMHNDEIHALEFNWGGERAHSPASNSFFYERGNPTQYIMQYGLAFSIASVDELSYLDGVDHAIMVPAGSMGSVKATPNRLPEPPNGTILQTLNQSDPDYEYQPDKLYWANNYTVQECIKVVKGAGTQRVPQSMVDAFGAAGRYQGNKSSCDFGYGRVLYGPKDDGSPGVERWYMYGDNTPAHPYSRHQYASPFALKCRQGDSPNEAMISRQGLNEAPVADQIGCPDNTAVRNRSNGEVFWVTNDTIRLVPNYDTLACLTQGTPGSPIDMDESLLSTVPRGANAACSFANRLLREPGSRIYWVRDDGQKHYVGNPLILNCISVRANAGSAWDVPGSVLDHISDGSNAYCPYPESIHFVRGDGQAEVWLVHTDGTRQHALGLCPGDDPRFQVYVVPAGEVDGHRYTGDFSPNTASCAAL